MAISLSESNQTNLTVPQYSGLLRFVNHDCMDRGTMRLVPQQQAC